VLIGNGTGLAGLRAHLQAAERRLARPTPRQRLVTQGRHAWLLLGERQAAHDALCDVEITHWLASGVLSRTDRVYSRDGGPHRHVQERLAAEAPRLRDWVEAGAVILLCGSRQGMASGVEPCWPRRWAKPPCRPCASRAGCGATCTDRIRPCLPDLPLLAEPADPVSCPTASRAGGGRCRRRRSACTARWKTWALGPARAGQRRGAGPPGRRLGPGAGPRPEAPRPTRADRRAVDRAAGPGPAAPPAAPAPGPRRDRPPPRRS
jgi:hypothetical protein